MTGLRFLGIVFFVVIVVGSTFHMNGHKEVALMMLVGGVSIGLVIIAKVFRRFWW